MGTRFFYNKPKTSNKLTMDQLTKQFELALIISDKQETSLDDHHLEPSDLEDSSLPFKDALSDLDYSNADQEVQYSQSCSSTQQQVKKSICQPNIMGTTENKPKKLMARKGKLMETLPINRILNLWKRSGITNGRSLLTALGFKMDQINIADLKNLMEKHISNMEGEPQIALMKACLVLQSEELCNLRQFSKKLSNENAKLKAYKNYDNKRSSLLAPEIFERNSSMVRRLTARLANERENWSNLNSRLESKLKLIEKEGIRTKTELELVRKENEELLDEKLKIQKQVADLLEKNIELQRENVELIKYRKSTIEADNDASYENNDTNCQEEIENIRKKIEDLEAELKHSESQLDTPLPTTSVKTSALEERCKELENSLEEMKRAYEDSEDYWQNKIADERNMYEQELKIFEEEQRESDRKFNRLLEEMREYEEQFRKEKRLPAIAENDMLEEQYAFLEAEAEVIRETAHKMFEEKSKEIEDLKSEIKDLRMRLGDSIEILTDDFVLKSDNVANSTFNIIECPWNSLAAY